MDMPLWAVILVALGGFGGVGALVNSLSTARNAAKKTDFDALRGTVQDLQTENKRLRDENEKLHIEVNRLTQENIDLRKAIGLPEPEPEPETGLELPRRKLATRDSA